MKIALFAPQDKSDLSHWLQHLGATLNPSTDLSEFQFVIDWHSDNPIVTDSDGRKLCIDFDQDHITYQRKQLRGKNEPLAKALGLGKGTQSVLDLSVGMAADSVLLCQLGLKVTGVERSALLFFLLKQAFAVTSRAELKDYQLVHEEALVFLDRDGVSSSFDAIYFDPMYPHPAGKKKTALPKQEMVIFRELVGKDLDADKVLEKALKSGVKKIVVKRPHDAAPLAMDLGFKPSHSIETKVVRFDVYVRS